MKNPLYSFCFEKSGATVGGIPDWKSTLKGEVVTDNPNKVVGGTDKFPAKEIKVPEAVGTKPLTTWGDTPRSVLAPSGDLAKDSRNQYHEDLNQSANRARVTALMQNNAVTEADYDLASEIDPRSYPNRQRKAQLAEKYNSVVRNDALLAEKKKAEDAAKAALLKNQVAPPPVTGDPGILPTDVKKTPEENKATTEAHNRAVAENTRTITGQDIAGPGKKPNAFQDAGAGSLNALGTTPELAAKATEKLSPTYAERLDKMSPGQAAAEGALAGSVVPGVGTLIGAFANPINQVGVARNRANESTVEASRKEQIYRLDQQIRDPRNKAILPNLWKSAIASGVIPPTMSLQQFSTPGSLRQYFNASFAQ